MGKSYRKPYAAITGVASAKDDKRVARRALRRMENQRIRNCKSQEDFELLCMPDRLDAAYNDTWSWGRDGSQYIHFPPKFGATMSPWWNEKDEIEWYDYQVKYYLKLCRK
jgi:hypothetical protein